VNATNTLERSANEEICLPANESKVKVNENLSFTLSLFKPGKYKIVGLGFPKHISSSDTLFCKEVSITKNNKTAFQWIPQKQGTFYWLLYLPNHKNPYLVRKLIVE
jgi:hypothetical protein